MKRAILFLMLVVFAVAAIAQTNTWTGAADTQWDNSDNWTLNRVPLSTDNIVILGAIYQPILTGGITANCYSITISGDAEMAIESAILNVNQNVAIAGALWVNHEDAVINLGGNWSRTGLFSAGPGRVVFNDGNYFQDCANETFNILEVNKPSGGNLRINSATVTCAVYDWTAGGIEVLNGGTFTANKLQDNSIYGTYYLSSGCTINLHNVGGWVDLNGELNIHGGEFNVYGGTLPSYWPYDGNAVINMSDGILDFKDVGILIYNTPYYTLTENITGGTIRTSGGYTSGGYTRGGYSGNRVDFAPSAGTFEFYGSGDFTISQTGGSTLHHVKINKSFRNDDEQSPSQPIYDTRSGKLLSDGTRANTISLASSFTTTGKLELIMGTLEIDNHVLSINEDAELAGTVVFSHEDAVMNANGNLVWKSGSAASIGRGLINAKKDWKFEDGSNIELSADNLVKFSGSVNQEIINQSENSHFGNVSIDQAVPTFVIFGASSNKPMHITGNVTIQNGQRFILEGHKTLNIEGNLELSGKLDVLANATATISSEISFPASGWLSLNSGNFVSSYHAAGTHDLYGKITMNSGSTLDFAGRNVFIRDTFVNDINGGLLRFGRNLSALYTGTFQLNSGTVEFYGEHQSSIQLDNLNYLNDLIIAKASANSYVYLGLDLIVKGNVSITTGNFIAATYTLNVGGNWENNAFFDARTGKVVFDGGNYDQTCTNTTFNILEINKPSGGNVVINGYTVSCAQYEWTAGGIEVKNGGTFTANDLADDGIYGSWNLSGASEINLTNSGSHVNLNGHLHISGGTFNVHGGSGHSYWPYAADASITMSNGILDFHDAGIIIYHLGAYSLTENITGGLIRTSGDFEGYRSDFTPSGGTIEFYGPDDSIINQYNGCTLHHIKINKSVRTSNENEIAKENGSNRLSRNRANTLKLDSPITLTGNLEVSTGTLDLRSYSMNVGGSANISANVLFSSIYSGLHVNQHIFWFFGSSAVAGQGLISLKGNWYFYYGCEIQLESENTVTFNGTGSQDIVFYDDNSYFGNVELAQTGSSEVRVSVLSDYDAVISGNLSIPSGQIFTVQNNQTLTVEGELDLAGKLNILEVATVITENQFNFPASGWLSLTNAAFLNDYDSIGFHRFHGKVTMNSNSLLDFKNDSVFIESTFVNEISGGLMRFGRGLYASYTGTFQLNSGTVEFYGSVPSAISLDNGNYLPNLTIMKDGNYLEVYLERDLTVKNNLSILSGKFLSVNFDINVGGNWINNTIFESGSGKVVFDGGNYDQTCTNTTFNILEINKPSGGNVVIDGAIVTCAQYNWTAGGIEVKNGGTFTANDLADDGIYGSWYLSGTSEINLTNSGSHVNLNGHLHISGGTFNVHEGFGSSWWPYDADASITMSGGVLDFHDVGIYIYHVSSYSLTENITGGLIRTVKGFAGFRTDFTPSAGTFEFYGSGDYIIKQFNGCTLHHVKINKAVRNSEELVSSQPIFDPRSGILLSSGTKANTITLSTDIDITGNLDVVNGTLDLDNYAMNVNGTANISANVLFSTTNAALHVYQHIHWLSGSSVNANQGQITLKENWYFHNGSDVQLASGNLVKFTGLPLQYIVSNDESSCFGDVELAMAGSGEVQISSLSEQPVNISGNVFVPEGQTFSVSANKILNVDGNLSLVGKLNILQNSLATIEGEFFFPATGWLSLNEGNFVNNDSTSEYWVNLFGKLTMNSGSIFDFTGRTISIGNTFTNEINGGLLRFGRGIEASSIATFQLNNGTVEFHGSGQSVISISNGNYLNNLTISKETNSNVVGLSNDLNVKNNVSILSGNFKPFFYNINVGGNWLNNAIFEAGPGRVVFDGATNDQICTNTTFHTLEVDKSIGKYVFIENTEVICAEYDWTEGGIKVNNAGTFTANKLLDNSIYGTFYVSENGIINLHNTDGWVDLNGELNISGGEFNVYGGTLPSYWPFDSNAVINMSGGVLDFKDSGILIFNSPTYSLTENITGGTIRTAGGFEGNRADFTPSAGTFEFYGSDTYGISQYNGCTLHHVVINKGGRGSEVIEKGIPVFDERSGKMLSDGTRSHSILLHSDVTFSGDLTVQSGDFDLASYKCEVLGTTEIFGNLTMNDINNDFTSKNINWRMNSSADVNQGTFHAESWFFDEGTIAKISAGNTAYLESIYFPMSNEGEFGNLVRLPSSRNIEQSNERNTYYPFRVMGNYTIKSGANSIYLEPGAHLLVAGNSTIEAGASIKFTGANFVTNGNLDLSGYLLVSNENQAIVHGDVNFPAAGWLELDNADFICYYDEATGLNTLEGKITTNEGSNLEFWGRSINIGANFVNEISHSSLKFGRTLNATIAPNFQLSNSLIEFVSTNTGHYVNFANGNFVHGFSVDKLYGNLSLSSDLLVTDDVLLKNGTLLAGDKTITIHGDWINEAYPTGFSTGSGKVIFTGSETQSCSSENFNILEIDKAAEWLINSSGADITCQIYDWTDGGIWINDGSFTAQDLADDGLYGGFHVTNGTIDLHQGSDGLIDINGSVQIGDGGTLNVHGGGYSSYWSFDGNAHINMTGGVLDFKDRGIVLHHSPTYTLTTSITAGTIRTAGGFTGNRADFNPSGGTIELYGGNDVLLAHGVGSNFHQVSINKETRQTENRISEESLDRFGKLLTKNNRANTVTLNSDINLTGELAVSAGTIHLNGFDLSANENVSINNGGTLFINDDARLLIASNKNLSVNPFGIVKVLGSEGAEATITRTESGLGGFYSFTVESDGVIMAEHAIFEYMNGNGIHLKAGSVVDAVHSFHSCTFRNGTADGALLTIHNEQEITVNHAVFPENTWGGLYNVYKNVDSGVVHFEDASGDFSGSSYEYDPFHRIHWGTLTAPANVTIQIIGNDVVLSWDAVAGATSYKVYSADVPNQAFSIDGSGVFSGTTWTAPIAAAKKFYRVTAIR